MKNSSLGLFIYFIAHFFVGMLVVYGGMTMMKILHALDAEFLTEYAIAFAWTIFLILLYTKKEILRRHPFLTQI